MRARLATIAQSTCAFAFDRDAVPQQRVRDDRARLDRAAVAQHGVRPDDGIGRDMAVEPDEHRWPHRRGRDRFAPGPVDLGGQPERHGAVEDVAVGAQVRLGLAEVDPVVVGGEGVQRTVARADQLGEGLALDRHRPAGRDPGEDLALEQIGAGVDLVRGGLVARRLLDERLDAAVRVVDDGPERAGVVDVDQVQRADAALAAVVVEHRAQVERGEDVAVEDEERAVDELLDVLERAGRAERRVLDDVAQPQPQARAVAEVRRDRVGQIARGQDDVVDPGLLDAAQRPLEERHVHDRDHGLGRLEGERPKPRTLTADENDCLHGSVSIGSGVRDACRSERLADRARVPRRCASLLACLASKLAVCGLNTIGTRCSATTTRGMAGTRAWSGSASASTLGTRRSTGTGSTRRFARPYATIGAQSRLTMMKVAPARACRRRFGMADGGMVESGATRRLKVRPMKQPLDRLLSMPSRCAMHRQKTLARGWYTEKRLRRMWYQLSGGGSPSPSKLTTATASGTTTAWRISGCCARTATVKRKRSAHETNGYYKSFPVRSNW